MRERLQRRCRLLTVAVTLAAAQMAGGQGRRLDSLAVRHWAALLAVHDARVIDTVAVDSALASAVPELRAAAARVVGLNRIAARYGILRTLLRADRDTAVRSDAAFALGLATDAGSCDALRQALSSPGTGAAAAWALGELGPRCGEFAALLGSATAVPARSGLLRVAGKWTPFPDSIVVATARTTRLPDIRWSALYALARARRTGGANVAFDAVRDSSATIRELAARLLAATIIAPGDSSRAIIALERLLRDRAPHTRIAAIRSIATYKAAAYESVRRAWPLERDANVRVTMAQSIASVASESAPIWSEWWNGDTTHMVRRSLIASAWQAGAIATLQRAAGDSLDTHPDFRLRLAMIEGAAAQNPDTRARRSLPRLADPDPRVRAAAVSAIAASTPATRESLAWSALRDSALHDADVGVREAALRSLATDTGTQALALAMDGYLRAAADTSSDAREAALTVIARAWRRDSSAFGAEVLERLRALPPAPDPLLRARVAGVPPLAHWATAAASPAATTDYARIVREVVVPALAGRPRLADIITDRGPIRIALDGVRAPMTVFHMAGLADRGYFRDMRFHRVVPAFVVQGGDPRGDGSGGPGVAIRDELNRLRYLRGAVGMALSGPDTGGSQFFLTLAPQPHLDGHYTVFGRVIRGTAVMDAIVQSDALRTISPIPQ